MDLMQSLIASKLLGGGGGSEPVLKTKAIYENGTYSAIEDEADGYSSVTVDVPKNVTSRGLTVNGTFSSAVDNKDGYSNVTVNVQEAPVKTTSLTVTENGTYEPDPVSEVSLTIPTIPDEVETDVSAGATITNFDNLRIDFINKTTGTTGHVDIYPSAIAIQQIPMSFKDRTLIMGPDGNHYITLVNGYDSIVVLQKGYTITAMKLTSYSGYFDEVNVNVQPSTMEKSISANGTYIAANDNVDGYSKAIVNVPPEPITEAKTVENLPQSIASFNNGAEAPITSLKVAIEPQQEGSGDPSPTNVRPISGWTEEVITRTGKNLFDKTTIIANKILDDKTGEEIIAYSRFSSDYIKVNSSTDYYASNVIKSAQWYCAFYYDKNKNYLSCGYLSSTEDTASGVITTPSNCNYVRLVSLTTYKDDVSLVVGNQAPTTYEPYNGQTYTIDLDGTRYGGEVDVVNGIVTPAPYYASYNGETLTGEWISDRDKYEVGATPTIGAQVVNIGASGTPVSILPTAIKSLRGVNNVYANTGEINDVDYIYVNDEVGTLINKTITANGSYCAVTDDNADGYLNIDVNVEGGGGGDIYKYHWSNDGTICVREGLGEVKWFFKGYTTDSGNDLYPEELAEFFPLGALQGGVLLGPAYSTSDATEQVGWIGFYNKYIRVWSIDKGNLIAGTFYGVVDAADNTTDQDEVYTDPLDIPDIDISVIEKTITENGTYSAENDGYVGYSDVVVNIPVGTIIPTIKLKTTTTITTEVI